MRPEYRYLSLNDLPAYASLCLDVQKQLQKNGTEAWVDFLTMPQCCAAITDNRLVAMWLENTLAAAIIAEPCNVKARLAQRFIGDALDKLDFNGVYLRNGLVAPAFQGHGFYNMLMSYVASLYADDFIFGTINIDNTAPQYACAAAGMSITEKIICKQNNAEKYIVIRYPLAKADVIAA